jgi:hypothetical protein
VLKVYGLPAMAIANVTLGCLEGFNVGSTPYTLNLTPETLNHAPCTMNPKF